MSPRQRSIPYGEARQALVDAAIKLVARDGLRALTYRSVAAEANASKGAFQHHFANLDELIVAALRQCLELSVSRLDLATTIESFFEPLLDGLHNYPEALTFQAVVALEARSNPALRAAVLEHQNAYRSILRDGLTAMNLEPDDNIIELLLATADGIVFQHVAHGDAADAARQVDGLRRLTDGYRFAHQADGATQL